MNKFFIIGVFALSFAVIGFSADNYAEAATVVPTTDTYQTSCHNQESDMVLRCHKPLVSFVPDSHI